MDVAEVRKREVGIVVSSSYCRYISLPWSDAMLVKQTRSSYLRSAFAEVYGNAAYNWEMTVQAAPYGQSRIACAMDSAVLQTLRQECTASGVSIRFCRPYFDIALDCFRGYGFSKAGILAVVEQDVLTIGQWHEAMITEIDVEPHEGAWEVTLEAWCARQILLNDALPEVWIACPPQLRTREIAEHLEWKLLEWPEHVRELVSTLASLALPAAALQI